MDDIQINDGGSTWYGTLISVRCDRHSLERGVLRLLSINGERVKWKDVEITLKQRSFRRQGRQTPLHRYYRTRFLKYKLSTIRTDT